MYHQHPNTKFETHCTIALIPQQNSKCPIKVRKVFWSLLTLTFGNKNYKSSYCWCRAQTMKKKHVKCSNCGKYYQSFHRNFLLKHIKHQVMLLLGSHELTTFLYCTKHFMATCTPLLSATPCLDKIPSHSSSDQTQKKNDLHPHLIVSFL